MARLPRLVVPGHAHLVVQRGHGDRPVFADDIDRASYLAALRESAPASGVRLLAWALLDHQVLLLARPTFAHGISRLLQSVGRRFVSGVNRRHGRSGTLWDGRFRCAPVEPGGSLLDLLAWIDGLAPDTGHTSAGLRLAGRPDALLDNPPEYWALGNTPFEREAVYRRRLADGVAASLAQSWQQAATGGWAIGSKAYADELGSLTQRPVRPRPAGRPRKAPAGGDGTPRA